jgi:hypothetical protein
VNGTDQLLAYGGGVNLQGKSMHTTKKNTEALLVASKEIILEVNAEKTKFMFMRCE